MGLISVDVDRNNFLVPQISKLLLSSSSWTFCSLILAMLAMLCPVCGAFRRSQEFEDSIFQMPSVSVVALPSRYLHRPEQIRLTCSVEFANYSRPSPNSGIRKQWRRLTQFPASPLVTWFHNSAPLFADDSGQPKDENNNNDDDDFSGDTNPSQDLTDLYRLEGDGHHALVLIATHREAFGNLKGAYSCAVNLHPYGVVASPSVLVEVAEIKKLQRRLDKDRAVHAHVGSSAFIPCVVPEIVPEAGILSFDFNGTLNISQTPTDGASADDFAPGRTRIVSSAQLDLEGAGETASSRFLISKNGLQISDVRMEDSGSYRCAVQNSLTGQQKQMRAVTQLTVEASQTEQPTKIVFPTAKQTALSFAVGSSAFLECVVSGVPQGSVRWVKEQGSLPEVTRLTRLQGNLLIKHLKPEDAGTYGCHVVQPNEEAVTNTDSTLPALPTPQRLKQQRQASYATYSVSITGNVEAKMSIGEALSSEADAVEMICEGRWATEIRWLYNGEPLPNEVLNRRLRITDMGFDSTNEISQWKMIVLRPPKSGVYQCLASSAAGAHSQAIYLASSEDDELFATELFTTLATGVAEAPTAASNHVTIDLKSKALPVIKTRPEAASRYEGDMVLFRCDARRANRIVWLKNGTELAARVDGQRVRLMGSGSLHIEQLKASDSGLYTCMAVNENGNVTASASLRVDDPNSLGLGPALENSGPESNEPSIVSSPGRFHKDNKARARENNDDDEDFNGEEEDYDASDDFRGKSNRPMTTYEAPSTATELRSSSGGIEMFRMDAPELHGMADNSVLVTWQLPKSAGQGAEDHVRLFKIQYKEAAKKAQWQTLDVGLEPYVRSHTVHDLQSGVKYRFRIGVIFLNNDHTVGKKSPKFLLQAFDSNGQVPPVSAPKILQFRALSPSAIRIAWEYPLNDQVPVSGFNIFYRPFYAGSNNGPFINTTVVGSETREHILDHLLPATPYEIQMSAFNLGGQSVLSKSVQQSTLTSDGTLPPYGFQIVNATTPAALATGTRRTRPIIVQTTPPAKTEIRQLTKLFNLETQTLLIILGGVLGFLILTLILFVTICTCRQRKQEKIHRLSKGKFRDTAWRIHRENTFLSERLLDDDAKHPAARSKNAYTTLPPPFCEQTANGQTVNLYQNPLLTPEEQRLTVDRRQRAHNRLNQSIDIEDHEDGDNSGSEDRREGSAPECDMALMAHTDGTLTICENSMSPICPNRFQHAPRNSLNSSFVAGRQTATPSPRASLPNGGDAAPPISANCHLPPKSSDVLAHNGGNFVSSSARNTLNRRNDSPTAPLAHEAPSSSNNSSNGSAPKHSQHNRVHHHANGGGSGGERQGSPMPPGPQLPSSQSKDHLWNPRQFSPRPGGCHHRRRGDSLKGLRSHHPTRHHGSDEAYQFGGTFRPHHTPSPVNNNNNDEPMNGHFTPSHSPAPTGPPLFPSPANSTSIYSCGNITPTLPFLDYSNGIVKDCNIDPAYLSGMPRGQYYVPSKHNDDVSRPVIVAMRNGRHGNGQFASNADRGGDSSDY